MNLERNRQLAHQKQKEHRKFLEALKRRPPRNLDQIVQEIHSEVFKKVDCLACGNCCRYTGPLLTEKDKDRIARLLRMKVVDFEAKYLRIDEDGDWVFQKLPCPFLGEDNHCSIYEDRPKACREYPHTDRKKIYQINHLTIKNIKECPAAYKWIERMMEKLL